MSLKTFLKRRGLTLDVLDYQQQINKRDESESRNSQIISKVYDKWLDNQPKEVTENLPKHWTK